jgi:DNA-binding CsgD family transcriptional regulator
MLSVLQTSPESTEMSSRSDAPRGGSSAATIKVAVVDEHEMFALGLRSCLAEHSSVEVMPRPDGPVDVAIVSPQVAREVRLPCPLVVCGDAPTQLAAGNVVLAVLPRATLTTGQLIASVHAAAAGLRVTSPDGPRVSRLQGRRLEVLGLLATGADTREIAARLGYSDRTIKGVIQEIQVALGARSRAHAVAEGIRQGLI